MDSLRIDPSEMKRRQSQSSYPVPVQTKLLRQNTQTRVVELPAQPLQPSQPSQPAQSAQSVQSLQPVSIVPQENSGHRTLVAQVDGVSYRSEMWVWAVGASVERKRTRRTRRNGPPKRTSCCAARWASWASGNGKTSRSGFRGAITCSACSDGRKC